MACLHLIRGFLLQLPRRQEVISFSETPTVTQQSASSKLLTSSCAPLRTLTLSSQQSSLSRRYVFITSPACLIPNDGTSNPSRNGYTNRLPSLPSRKCPGESPGRKRHVTQTSSFRREPPIGSLPESGRVWPVSRIQSSLFSEKCFLSLQAAAVSLATALLLIVQCTVFTANAAPLISHSSHLPAPGRIEVAMSVSPSEIRYAPGLGDGARHSLTAVREHVVRSEVSGRALVLEAWSIVRDAFADARGNGWSKGEWEVVRSVVLERDIATLTEARAMVSSMVAFLRDPYSRFVPPSQFAQWTKYDVSGIGINVGETSGEATAANRRNIVQGVLLGSPAFSAGLREGDELVRVGGSEVRAMSPFDVASLIQASGRDAPVDIDVRRPHSTPDACQAGADGLCSFTVLRSSEIPGTPVSYQLQRGGSLPPSTMSMLGDNPSEAAWAVGVSTVSSAEEAPEGHPLSGYIQIMEFNSATKREVAEAVGQIQAAGVQSLVLDLRYNPGGLVQAAVEVASLFLDPGSVVVYTQARGEATRAHTVSPSALPALSGVPMTVLVNGQTASAAEILAAALHDNCRAVLVGSDTYGKGLIQAVYGLQDGSGVILTVGKYVTPGHRDIDRQGIVPDFSAPPGKGAVKQWLTSCQPP